MRLEREAMDSQQTRALSRLLGLDPSRRIFTMESHTSRASTDTICIELRSLVGIIFFLSHATQIPEHDLAAGRVTITRNENGEPFDWSLVIGDMLNIRSSDEPPTNAAVAINYRDSWFTSMTRTSVPSTRSCYSAC
jgi:hypothetical protein